MRCCRRPRGCTPASGCTGGARPRSCRASVRAGAAPCTRRWRGTRWRLPGGGPRPERGHRAGCTPRRRCARPPAGVPTSARRGSPWRCRPGSAPRPGGSARWHSTRVQCCGNWQVFDWPAVLAALLAERARSEALPAGEALVGIAGAGCLRLWVDGAAAGCELTDAEPQVRLNAAAALRALGGPLPGCFPEPDADTAALRHPVRRPRLNGTVPIADRRAGEALVSTR